MTTCSGSFIVSFFLLIIALRAHCADFSCPTNPLTNGVFPKDTLGLTTFPANYQCGINFQISDGFVLKLTIQANVTDDRDSFIVTDTLSNQQKYTDGVSLFYAPANDATVQIKSMSGNSQFWFRYEFIFVGYLEQELTPTGSTRKLDLVNTKFYTFTSPYDDNVVMNTAVIDRLGEQDTFTRNIYVYDGPDVKSPFVGNLFDFVNSTRSKSSGKSLTLLNMYGTPSLSYLIANDYKSIISYDTYTFVAFSKNVTISKSFMKNLGISNAFTFLSTEKSEVYITDMDFGNDGHKLDFRPLTPSDTNNILLTYKSNDPVSQMMPQLIPGKKFTMVALGTDISLSLSTTTSNWLTSFNGRKGSIFSSSLWIPGAITPYNYTFESSELMTFTFNVQSAIIHQGGDQIAIQVGRPGASPANVVFTHTVTNQYRAANGTYLMAQWTGVSPTSTSIVTFEMVNANGQLPTTRSPMSNTTTPTMETSTKSGFQAFDLSSIISLFLTTFILSC